MEEEKMDVEEKNGERFGLIKTDEKHQRRFNSTSVNRDEAKQIYFSFGM